MSRFLCFAFLFLALAAVTLANQRPTPPPTTKAPPPPTTTKKVASVTQYKLSVSGAKGCSNNLNLVCQASSVALTSLETVFNTEYSNGKNNVVKVLLQVVKKNINGTDPRGL